MKNTAIVVTYNRLSLLKECIHGILSQTKKADNIIVINNQSTDGTGEWLATQPVTTITQENKGGAWGFFTGIKSAYESGADWIWVMDDDTIPQPDALEMLLKCSTNTNLQKFGFFVSKAIWTDGSPHVMNLPDINTFIKGTPFSTFDSYGATLVNAASFVSILISKEAVFECGLPMKEFYIWADDVEFTSRITGAGFLAAYVKDSVVLHKTATNYGADIYQAEKKDAWKHVYGIRNKLYIKKKKKGIVRFWFSVLKNYLFIPFSILRKRKYEKLYFIKIVWKATTKAIGFNPKIEKV